MNRRPKLSLVSNRALDKKQALGFEATKQAELEQPPGFEAKQPDSAEEIPRSKPFRSEQLVADSKRDDHPKNSGWLNGRRLATAVVVVVTAALSLYLLKRRLL